MFHVDIFPARRSRAESWNQIQTQLRTRLVESRAGTAVYVRRQNAAISTALLLLLVVMYWKSMESGENLHRIFMNEHRQLQKSIEIPSGLTNSEIVNHATVKTSDEMKSPTSIHLKLTPGFNCLQQTEQDWVLRLDRIRALGGSRAHAVNFVPGDAQLIAQITLEPSAHSPLDDVLNVPVVFIQQQGIKSYSNSYADMAISTACKFNQIVFVVIVHNMSDLHHETADPRKWSPPTCATVRRLTINGTLVGGLRSSERLQERLSTFARYYRHMSGNPRSFEQFCIERWFVLEALMDLEDMDAALYVDSDVLVFANASLEWAGLSNNCAAQINRNCVSRRCDVSGHSTYWTKGKLEQLSNFLIDAYTPTRPYLAQINADWARYQESYLTRHETVEGGVTDMWLIGMFKDFFTDGMCYSDSSSYDYVHGFTDTDFVQDDVGLPYRLHIRTNLPDRSAELVPMKSLHFQGDYKTMLVDCEPFQNHI